MGFNCGIIGLPNVGKSSLFNALTSTLIAESQNYPFCTIEPNIGRVAVPDKRLDEIALISQSENITPTFIEIVDIAGLIHGASNGDGLGNQFLARIREVDALIHVLRCFESNDTVHIEGTIDPERDLKIVETELVLADIQIVERRIPILEKLDKAGEKNARYKLEQTLRIYKSLNNGIPVRKLETSIEENLIIENMNLLTSKPVLYVCNVDEENAKYGNNFSKKIEKLALRDGSNSLIISAAVEAEIAQFQLIEEKVEFLNSLGLQEPGLANVVRSGYRLLDLLTFFTTGSKETRAWTIPKGALAGEAAGRVHSDFQRGFICAETIAYNDFIEGRGELGAKDSGKMRQEGKDYIIQDGDIILFRFNV